ncbi:sigma-70 family RNA polymerase sigma factor [Leptolyngbya cf. ectocarpi LEGE 11479]|uniref:Sigma-70 family RNA polymerase sigma factor n=1 Tax=Leptolyngbya cf. ectocarpi LEGE 11479 TaxID=1828722 RepID=A0A928ZXC5_LEPEC|nr:sigma-70 family RNA polymerase sigma factor [Leptolyngbya ectocarpi]MBE9069177.1 sigma-70 family RNA polymerase sigma factor [Leptolyngbya cf. ectocarpi LEGE 11479]
MRPRTDLIEQFSAFLVFDGDRFRRWLSDVRFRQSMERCLTQAGQTSGSSSANFWALFWHQQWQVQSSRTAKGHLQAYAQECCYDAADNIVVKFGQKINHGREDCFQLLLTKFDRVLNGFDTEKGRDFKAYASTTFRSLLKEILRQRNEIDICTPWALLRKTGPRTMQKSLTNEGLSPLMVEQYLLVFAAFRQFYIPQQAAVTRQLPEPDRETLISISAYYNQEKGNYISQPSPPLNPDEVFQILIASAKAARLYQKPKVLSANVHRSDDDENDEWLDTLKDEDHSLPLSELIEAEEAKERSLQRAQVNEILVKELQNLDNDSKQLLKLYYQDNCIQEVIAETLNIKQYTVSRRLNKIRKVLLTQLVQWSQETLHIDLNPNLLKSIGADLDEWLVAHYGCASAIDTQNNLAEDENEY